MAYDFMKTNKDNLKNVIRDPDKIKIIDDMVLRTNEIVIRAYQFIKLYLIYQYENDIKFSMIDEEFMRHVYSSITDSTSGKGRKKYDKMCLQQRQLVDFYKEHYIQTLADCYNIFYDKLNNNLNYEATDMITNINNNIIMNYVNHLNRYVNIKFDYKAKLLQIKQDNPNKIIRDKLCKKWQAEINLIKDDLCCFDDLKSDIKYHIWINKTRSGLYPYRTIGANVENTIKDNPQEYLVSMFYICTKLEKMNDKQVDPARHVKLINVLPLRSNIIPKNICIDTTALIINFLPSREANPLRKTFKKNNNHYDVWNRFFNLDLKVFKKGDNYKFSHMIRTDGISCSILFVRLNDAGVPMKKKEYIKTCPAAKNIEYIEKVTITEEMHHMKVVCADPGHSDLIYCASHNEAGDLETFRYTQNQRRSETRIKKYGKIINNLNNTIKIRYNGNSVKENEVFPPGYDSKACSYGRYMNYCEKKNEMNHLLLSHYEKPLFRKLKFNRFINTQKSENRLIKNFSKKFGPPSDTIFVIGDYSKGSYNMKGLEPAICKKFRRIFKLAGYQTYLINEYKTSITCNNCYGKLETFLIKPSQKPKNKGNPEKCHGLLRCQSNAHCAIIHNRDKNAAQNMLNIVYQVFESGKRPAVFSKPS